MPFDAHKNLAIAGISTAPSPPDTGTSLGVMPGQGARFPAPPFNVTLMAAAGLPTPANAEVARVTAIAGDLFTLIRAQEGTTARMVTVGDLIAETITAKALQDIESGANFPLITTPGPITSGGLGTFDYVDVINTLDAASVTAQTVDASSQITAPLGQFGDLGTTPLNAGNLFGTVADARLTVNVLKFTGGYPGGTANFLRADGTFAAPPGGGGVSPHHATHEVGGSDQITGALSITTLAASGTVSIGNLGGSEVVLAKPGLIRLNTADGADTGVLQLTGGGSTNLTRGATLNLCGADNSASLMELYGGSVDFFTGPTTVAGNFRGRMHPSGGFSWGSSADPGANNLSVADTLFLSSATGRILSKTTDGADGGILQIGGGGFPSVDRGAYINLGGNESSIGGQLQLTAGNGAFPTIDFFTGPSATLRGRIHASGGFSWGGATDPGPSKLGLAGDLIFQGGGDKAIYGNLTTGANTGSLFFSAGNGIGANLGGYVGTYGNQYAALGGTVTIGAGNVPTGNVEFYSGGSKRGQVGYGGCLSWGGVADGGPGSMFVGASAIAGTAYIWIRNDGSFNQGTAGTTAANLNVFYNGNGLIGSIIGTGTGVAYNTTSDARLKTDRGLLTDPEVLRHTKIHHFTWNTDGTSGRGVFAQEAITVAPFAVSVGSDDRDEQGLLTHPWQVDYSKFVPDLIVGWQAHDAKVVALEAKVAQLEALIEKLLT